jgi:hypothetical protein
MALALEQASGGSFVLSKAGLAVGSTNTQLSTGAIAVYCLDGVFQTSKAATATFVAAAPTGFVINTTVPIGSKCAYGVWLDSAGNFTVTQGPIAPVNAQTDKVGPPPNPGSRALVGVFTAHAQTAVFILGTNVLTAGLNAGVFVQYFDAFSLPAQGF